ncbi:MAG: ABC transporter permease, partial [Chthoniobacterales bacterium]
MTPPLYIALHFLSHRKRAFVLSLCGVVFGVAIFICTQAQTQGFAQHFIDSTLGSNGALVMKSRFQTQSAGIIAPPKNAKLTAARRRSTEGIPDATEIMRVSRQFGNVAACSPVLRGSVSGRAGFDNATVDLFGIDAASHLKTTDLGTQLIEGDFETFRNNPASVIVGARLANTLGVNAGDAMQLLSPTGEFWRFTIAAIARSGVGAVDAARVYSHAKI